MAPFTSILLNAVCILTIALIMITIADRVKRWSLLSTDKRSIAIVVLGDLGRSPRMQRHGVSILKNEDYNSYDIHFIAFTKMSVKSIPDILKTNKRVTLHNIWSYRLSDKYPFLLYAICKVFSEIFSLLWILCINSNTIPLLTHILMQNPPSIPTVIVCKLSSIIRGSTLIIDWHNFGYTILRLRKKGLFVTCYRLIERYVGAMADIHLCVTNAMLLFLKNDWNFKSKKDNNVHVLYDLATDIYLDYNETENQKKDDKILWDDHLKMFFMECTSILDSKKDDLWMISSTSWTPDEDLNMLIDKNVLQSIDNQIDNDKNDGRKIVLFVTGKDEGSLKEKFVSNLEKLSLKYVVVIPLWLPKYANYVHLLRCCDIGICFHNSSSKLDLPMKVVDMFGAGNPVIAMYYQALPELVEENLNGFTFKNSIQLTDHILNCYKNSEIVQKMKKHINQNFRKKNWDKHWGDVFAKFM